MPSGLTDTIIKWESKGLSNKKIRSPITANYIFSPEFVWMNNSRIKVRLKRRCLKQDKVTFTSRNVVTLFILYELDTWLQDLNADFTLKECLFEVVKLTKTPDPDKYYFSGYGLVYLNHIFCQFFYNVFE